MTTKKGDSHALVRLDHLPAAELLDLFPREEIERIVGGRVCWRVLQRQDELMVWHLARYNSAVSTHVHRRSLLTPGRPNPLENERITETNVEARSHE